MRNVLRLPANSMVPAGSPDIKIGHRILRPIRILLLWMAYRRNFGTGEAGFCAVQKTGPGRFLKTPRASERT